MCLIVGAISQSARYPVVLALNRDEILDRPTAQAAHWRDIPSIFAGRDLVRGGTWAGVTQYGHIAAVTNFRTVEEQEPNRHSRGELVRSFLEHRADPQQYIKDVASRLGDYRHFNLLVGKGASFYAVSSKTGEINKITQGYFGISNGMFDEPWPKVVRAKNRLQEILAEQHDQPLSSLQSALIKMMSDRETPADCELPDTGVGLELERKYGPIRIIMPKQNYGTICTTVITIDSRGILYVREDTHSYRGRSLDPSSVEKGFLL